MPCKSQSCCNRKAERPRIVAHRGRCLARTVPAELLARRRRFFLAFVLFSTFRLGMLIARYRRRTLWWIAAFHLVFWPALLCVRAGGASFRWCHSRLRPMALLWADWFLGLPLSVGARRLVTALRWSLVFTFRGVFRAHRRFTTWRSKLRSRPLAVRWSTWSCHGRHPRTFGRRCAARSYEWVLAFALAFTPLRRHRCERGRCSACRGARRCFWRHTWLQSAAFSLLPALDWRCSARRGGSDTGAASVCP